MAEFEDILVVDIGSASVKAGFNGEDIPSSIFPSYVLPSGEKHPRTLESIESTGFRSDGSYDTNQPVQRGIVKDWDGIEKIYNMILNDLCIKTLENSSVMIVESTRATLIDKAQLSQMLFEKFRVPSICFSNNGSCSIFASGRTTGLVVDCGAGLTSTIPVFEGLALSHAIYTMEHGGQDVSAQLQKLLREKKDGSIPITLPNAKLIKETYCRADTKYPKHAAPTDKEILYLPDGTEVQIENRFFNECTIPIFKRVFNAPVHEKVHPAAIPPSGIVNQILESWTLCDDSIKKDLIQNVIMAGGGSMLTGLNDAIGNELKIQIDAHLNSKLQSGSTFTPYESILYPSNRHSEPGYTNQRKFAPWIGGSIFSSLESYKQLHITRQEWEESGDGVLLMKSF